METINFTNRERIEMGDQISTFVDYLSKKLPKPDYDSSAESPDDTNEDSRTDALSMLKVALQDPVQKDQLIRQMQAMRKSKLKEKKL